MTNKRYYIANPYDENHRRMFGEFEKKSDSKFISDYFKMITANYTNDNYIQMQIHNNEINETIFIMEENKIKDYCNLKIEKDLKTCELFFAPLKEMFRIRTIVSCVCNYALQRIGLKRIFVSIDSHELSIKRSLLKYNFENLGEYDGKIIFMRERE